MKIYSLGIILLFFSLSSTADPQFEIEGLIVDQTISRIGHTFYEELTNGWEIGAHEGTISVHERPDIFAGNIIWVEVDEVTVFQERMGTRAAGIEEKAAQARQQIESYLQKQKESLKGLEVY